ncbi:MAG: phosphate signaling complex protein PhoU [Planctomycetaceae bacterium]|nr:phosphate signaling complex protein PhoU [Planctomycetaceae bacterium]MCA9046421.1 phosphate signaling complex protein PhoU [Planctomycetaceae bacterium]MCB9951274.1 phosphate signaling complex protein PhoU [Planctomycetaceae bacterium]
MSVHMQTDIAALHKDLLAMCSRVEDMIHRAVEQLSNPDFEESRRIASDDDEIDRIDVEIEDACLKILALYQPVAIDLRRITAVMKISAELERVADLAVNISERACGLLESSQVQIPDQLKDMAGRAVDMLHRSIDAYVELDSAAARKVCVEDEEVDALNRTMIQQLIAYMHEHPSHLDASLHMFSAVRQVERVADHATNIAEDVVYLVEGRIIRHSRKLNSQPANS